MVRFPALLGPVLLPVWAVCQEQPPAIRYSSFVQGKATYHMVVADLANDAVSAETMFAPSLTSVRTMLRNDDPVAALTGTFFAWENEKPVGEVVVDGDLVAGGRRGSVLAVDWFGKVHIFHPRFREVVDWFPYRFALRGAVRLLEDGKVVPNPRAQKFRDKSIWGRAARTAVGVSGDGKVIMIATRSAVTLSQLGWALVGKGARDAVSLDGGGSTTLYYRGKMVIPAGRRLCNMFVLYERSPFDNSYQLHLSRVAQTQTTSVLKAVGRRTKK